MPLSRHTLEVASLNPIRCEFFDTSIVQSAGINPGVSRFFLCTPCVMDQESLWQFAWFNCVAWLWSGRLGGCLPFARIASQLFDSFTTGVIGAVSHSVAQGGSRSAARAAMHVCVRGSRGMGSCCWGTASGHECDYMIKA